MSNDREAAMVAPSSGSDDRRRSADGHSRAEEKYVDLGFAEVTHDPRKAGWDYRNNASEADENSKK